MSDTTPTDQPPAAEPEGVRNLREALERSQAQAQEGAAAQRELAFIKAGIPTDDGTPGALLLMSYSGELNPEAIAAEAAKYGIVPEAPTAPTAPVETPPVPPAQDPQQTQARQALLSDTLDPATPVTEGDPMKAAYAEFHQLQADGLSSQEASVAVLGKIFEQARAGNEDFTFDPEKWQSSEAAKSR